MFICGQCRKVQPERVKPIRAVVERERVNYPFRRGANRFIYEGAVKITDDSGGSGWQIIREISLCPSCASMQQQAS